MTQSTFGKKTSARERTRQEIDFHEKAKGHRETQSRKQWVEAGIQHIYRYGTSANDYNSNNSVLEILNLHNGTRIPEQPGDHKKVFRGAKMLKQREKQTDGVCRSVHGRALPASVCTNPKCKYLFFDIWLTCFWTFQIDYRTHRCLEPIKGGQGTHLTRKVFRSRSSRISRWL